MKRFLGKTIFIVFMFSLISPIKSAEALIPFEISLSETAGKVSNWVQEVVLWVNARIETISQSKAVTAIGDGIKKVKEVRNCIKVKYAGGNNPKCKEYEDKYSFLAKMISMAGDAQRMVKKYDAVATSIIRVTREISNDAIEIVNLEERRKQDIQQLKERAEINKMMLKEKINMAKEDLQIMKRDHDARKKGASSEEVRYMVDQETALEKSIVDMENELARTDGILVKRIADVDIQYTQRIAVVIARQQRRKDELLKLKDNKNKKEIVQKEPKEIVKEARNRYSASPDNADDIAAAEARREAIKADITNTNIAGINKTIVYVTEANSSDSNPEADAALGSSLGGASETVQASIDSTLQQIDLIQNIIQMELTSLEVRAMRVIMNNTGYKPKKLDQRDGNLVSDVCKYTIKIPVDNIITGTKSNKSSVSGKAASNEAIDTEDVDANTMM